MIICLWKLKYIDFAFKIKYSTHGYMEKYTTVTGKFVEIVFLRRQMMFIDYNNINELIEYMICFYIPKSIPISPMP